ncbi:aldolase [Spirochaetia bacterium]|nr:aldolase [Spirochaetia bacterium]
MIDFTAVKEILDVCLRLDSKGLVNAYEGNVSIKRDGYLYITPASKNKAFLKEEMICILEADSLKQVGGIFPPSSEMLLHTLSYQARPDIAGVIHCHAPYLTAFALCNKPVESKAYPEMMGNFKKIQVAPYGRPGTPAIFDEARELVKKNDVVLLANHGVLAVGKDIWTVMNKTEACESIAKVLTLAEQIGKPVNLSDDECQFFIAK